MRYLILGDGKLATELHKQTKWNYISRKKDNIDFENPDTYKKYIVKYDIIINCIAYTNTTDNNKDKHWNTNFKGVINLVKLCNKYHKKIIHISTDYIYSGSISNASEEDVPVHVGNWYTYTKLLADGFIQAEAQNYLLIRTSFKIKPYPWKIAWIDTVTNVDYIDIITDLIIKLIILNAQGVYNVGTDLKTYYQLALQTQKDCVPVLDDYTFERPHNVSMNLNKLYQKINNVC